MNRQDTDKEARSTKNTKNVWKWILGVGVVLMLIAFWGGFFNHKGSFTEAENATESNTAVSDTMASDTTMKVDSDTIMESVRGTQ